MENYIAVGAVKYMILTGNEIDRQVKLKRIHIFPYSEENLNPNSYNFRLGNRLKVYTEKELDSSKPNAFTELVIPETGFVLQPNQLYLGHTVEEMGSDFLCPLCRRVVPLEG